MRALPILLVLFTIFKACCANNGAIFALFHEVENEENLAIAPDALVDAFSLLYYGSAGNTEREFEKFLFGSQGKEEIRIQASKRVRQCAGFQSLGSLWYSPRIELTESFRLTSIENWGFHVEEVSLNNNIQAAVDRINSWYSIHSNGLFNDVVDSGKIHGNADLIGIITTAFIGSWKEEYFSKGDTAMEIFHESPKVDFQVNMMYSENSFSYYEDRKFQALSIDYKDNPFSLLLLLPKKPEKFERQVSGIGSTYFSKVVRNLHVELVQVKLPKVDFKKRIGWQDIVGKTHLKSAFSQGLANFESINANRPEPLFIQNLSQEVWLKWDEVGTEARSKMIFQLSAFGIPEEIPKPKKFEADHPFLFFLYNKESLDIIFMGIISSKSQMPLVGT